MRLISTWLGPTPLRRASIFLLVGRTRFFSSDLLFSLCFCWTRDCFPHRDVSSRVWKRRWRLDGSWSRWISLLLCYVSSFESFEMFPSPDFISSVRSHCSVGFASAEDGYIRRPLSSVAHHTILQHSFTTTLLISFRRPDFQHHDRFFTKLVKKSLFLQPSLDSLSLSFLCPAAGQCPSTSPRSLPFHP